MRFNIMSCGYLAAISIAHAAKSPGCGQALSKDITKGETGRSNSLKFKTSDGTEREYLLRIPESYDINTPTGLIWSYHGRGKDAKHQELVTGFSNSTANPNQIVVYPQGQKDSSKKKSSKREARRDDDDEEMGSSDEEMGGSDEYGDYGEYEGFGDDEYGGDESEGGDGGGGSGGGGGGKGGSKKGPKRAWQGDPGVNTDDVKFTLELLDQISKSYCIDDEKIYASGISNGGGFIANVLACDKTAAGKFAAFASASGAYYQLGQDSCDAKKVPIKCDNGGTKVALVTTAGGKDEVIPYEGGTRRKACLPAVQHYITAFAQNDGITAKPSESKVDKTDVVHYSFGEGASSGMVQTYYVPDLGHKWPTGDKKTHISATKIFLEFFDTWNMTARNAAASTLPASDSASSSSTSMAVAQSYQPLGLVIALLAAVFIV